MSRQLEEGAQTDAQKEGWTDRGTDRQRDRQTDSPKNRHMYKHRQKGEQTEGQTDRQASFVLTTAPVQHRISIIAFLPIYRFVPIIVRLLVRRQQLRPLSVSRPRSHTPASQHRDRGNIGQALISLLSKARLNNPDATSTEQPNITAADKTRHIPDTERVRNPANDFRQYKRLRIFHINLK